MRTRYIVTYDICDPKRLARVFRIMRGFGDHLQYSVFRCDLSDAEKIQMIEALTNQINSREDQVLIINIGPPDGRGGGCVETLGVASPPPVKNVVII
ncbi:MAG: CRISPR-associated endonuclease Cas2 [Candidatus Eremiobacteraeota bacterium]|nr:CRISPR-associated endonuclease Cas2 [Candidatus Eremiobacteraeota bacterium]